MGFFKREVPLDNRVFKSGRRGFCGLVALLMAWSAVGCGMEGGRLVDGDDTMAAGMNPPLVDGNYVVLDEADADGNLSIDLSEISGIGEDDELVLVLFNQSDNSSAQGFQVGASESTRLLVAATLSAGGEEEQGADPSGAIADAEAVADEDEDNAEEDLTEIFHDRLRDAEAEIAPEDVLEPLGSTPFLTRALSLGAKREFKVINSFASTNTYDTVSATLRYSGDEFEFYVDDRDAAALADTDLEELAAKFEAVLSTEHALFGNRSDVDGDGKFAVLFTQTVNKLGASAGGIVTGFFYAIDLLDADTNAASNESEVLYTFVPDPAGDLGVAITKGFAESNIYPGVLAHEYQHMINFNEHYFVAGGQPEKNFLNEGLAHLAEDIYLRDGQHMLRSGIENPSRVLRYLINCENVCFTCGANLAQRGGSYLFVRWLYEQAEAGNLPGSASGEEFLQNLVQTQRTGKANIVVAALGADAPAEEFRELLANFSLAVYFQGEISGLDLYAAQDDNRGTVLTGPHIQEVSQYPFTDTIQGSGIIYLSLKAADILAADGVLSLTFPTGSNFGGYLVWE